MPARPSVIALAAILVAGLGAWARAEEEAAPGGFDGGLEEIALYRPFPFLYTLPQALTPRERSTAARVECLTIPSPSELLAALAKEAKPNWQSGYRPPIPTNFSSRAKIALNIGGLLADGYIAMEAEDSQQVKNIGKDIITLAKSLAVSESVVARGRSIAEFAEANAWEKLRAELEATQNEVRFALEEQHDTDLTPLVTLGGWLRSLDAMSGWITENYTPGSARLLRQPGIAACLQKKVRELPERIREEPIVKKVQARLEEIAPLVSFAEDKTPSMNDVMHLKEITSRVTEEISRKKEAK